MVRTSGKVGCNKLLCAYSLMVKLLLVCLHTHSKKACALCKYMEELDKHAAGSESHAQPTHSPH